MQPSPVRGHQQYSKLKSTWTAQVFSLSKVEIWKGESDCIWKERISWFISVVCTDTMLIKQLLS